MELKTIEYNNKKIKMPFDVALPDDPTATDTVKNRFGGESCTLPAFAIAVYDVIIGAEMLQPDGDNALSVSDARAWAKERNIPFLEGAQLIDALGI